jgi:hypothetical protein
MRFTTAYTEYKPNEVSLYFAYAEGDFNNVQNFGFRAEYKRNEV